MNLKLAALLVFFTPAFALAHDNKDSILLFPVFNNAKEKQLFAEIAETGNTDYYQLLLNSTPKQSNDDDDRIAAYINTSNWFKNTRELTSKDLKKIYKEIHDRFLTQYVANPVFPQLFENGQYNCATASALYALLLDKLSVQYNIRETPTHVYIVAAPATYNLVFETTAPGTMIYSFNDKMKSQYIEYLANNKIITKEEINSTDKNELFEKHFYNSKPIELRQLSGLLYYNMAIAALDEKKYAEAYKNLEKAYFLYPETKIKYLLEMSLGAVLTDKDKITEQDKLPYLQRFLQVASQENVRDMASDYYARASKKYLFENPDPAKFISIFQILRTGVKDSTLANDLHHDYYMDYAHYYAAKEHNDSSLIYLDSLYKMNNNDLRVKELIGATLQDVIRDMPEKNVIDSIQFYFNKYPFLKSNKKLNEYYVYCLSKQIYDCYDKGNGKEGMKYLKLLRTAIDGQPELARKTEPYIMNGVGEACIYYIHKQETAVVKELLLFLKPLLPENDEVIRRLGYLDKK
ncbi:MAG: hypothetical protein J7497_04220 [Chitinophagaceae bacterium]|nr:hypothetical protein [Chitinophagaceae bacterium]